jgi:hypothetical protein
MDEIIDTTKAYLFTNAFTGSDLALAVSNKEGNGANTTLTMANATEAGSSSQWFLTRVRGNQPGIFFRIHAASMGLGQSIDVVNEGGAVTSTRLKMAESGDSSGQAWRFNRWSERESDGYRLSNKLSGPDVHLDVATDTLDARLFGGDFPGQHWMLLPVGGLTAAEQDTSSQPSDSDDGMFLSPAGVVSLTVMASLGLAVLVFWALLWWMRTRSRSIKNGDRVELNTETSKGLESTQYFQSSGGYGLYPLQSAMAAHKLDEETPSAGALYQQGSNSIGRSNTGLSGRTLGVGTVQPGHRMITELPGTIR